MGFTREQAQDFDAWLTREPNGDPQWCNECDCDSDDCEFPDEHGEQWISYEERDRGQRVDDAYDAYIDAMAEGDT